MVSSDGGGVVGEAIGRFDAAFARELDDVEREVPTPDRQRYLVSEGVPVPRLQHGLLRFRGGRGLGLGCSKIACNFASKMAIGNNTDVLDYLPYWLQAWGREITRLL